MRCSRLVSVEPVTILDIMDLPARDRAGSSGRCVKLQLVLTLRCVSGRPQLLPDAGRIGDFGSTSRCVFADK